MFLKSTAANARSLRSVKDSERRCWYVQGSQNASTGVHVLSPVHAVHTDSSNPWRDATGRTGKMSCYEPRYAFNAAVTFSCCEETARLIADPVGDVAVCDGDAVPGTKAPFPRSTQSRRSIICNERRLVTRKRQSLSFAKN